MALIIWGAGAGVLGLFLGYLGFLYSKMAYSVFTTCLGILVFCSNYLIQLTGGDMDGLARMQAEGGSIAAFGILRNVMNAVNAMGFFPFHVQVAILVFIVTFFLSRIATWAFKSFGPKKAEETPAERRARVLRSYGMKSMDDVRSMR